MGRRVNDRSIANFVQRPLQSIYPHLILASAMIALGAFDWAPLVGACHTKPVRLAASVTRTAP
jgi:hypothetical protein